MENVAVGGSRIHESCRLCTMKNVAFLPFEPWETSPLTMRNVALNYRPAGVHEKRRFGSAENKLPRAGQLRGTERQLFGLAPLVAGLPWKMSL